MKIFPILLFACALLGGCASDTAHYNFVYLKSGPQSALKTPEESKAIFQGHMANMSRLAAEKTLIIAGPFNKPTDSAWRGIFIFDVASTDKAREICSSDPGIQSGVFVQEVHPFSASSNLRTMLELEKQLNAARAANPTEPPKNIRGYVMITAADAARTRSAIESSSLSTRLIFDGTFTDSGGGVFVINSETVQSVREILSGENLDLGPSSIDSWWSSTALVGLKNK